MRSGGSVTRLHKLIDSSWHASTIPQKGFQRHDWVTCKPRNCVTMKLIDSEPSCNWQPSFLEQTVGILHTELAAGSRTPSLLPPVPVSVGGRCDWTLVHIVQGCH
jgi:hypothetical protein